MAGSGLPVAGPAVRGALLLIFGIWLTFAVAINWGDAGAGVFELLCGNTDAILHGELWRLFTAAFMHSPADIGHILFACIGLYFLTPGLEEQWGSARMVRFLVGSALISYSIQLVLELVLPASVGERLVPQYWFGAFPVLEAVAIAWACSFRGQTVRLFFVLPVTSRGLILFVIGFSILRVVAVSITPDGLLAPFGGMFAGWLLGASTPSPLRKGYLRLRLAQLDREAKRSKDERSRRVKGSKLRVIEGGKDDKGPDGNWLN